MAPNYFLSSVWNLLHVTLVTPRLLRWRLDFWTICASLHQVFVKTRDFSIVVQNAACWDCGFESRRGHGCLSVVSVVCLSGRGLCDGLITRSEESYRLCCVLVCDLEILKMRRLKPASGL
jgi:hypothetical protein